jgi:hypothetical protein
MWMFRQSAGTLEHNGRRIAGGYSGARSAGINLYETVRNFGPIPRGLYTIGRSFSRKSPSYVLSLSPVGHDADGRTGFLIHGDYRDARRSGTASEGCIILPLDIRKAIWDSRDRLLFVQF